MKIKTILPFILLHIIILFYSFGGIFSKRAASYDFLSIGFLANYGVVLLIMVIYAFLWQKIIKILPLTTAYSSKAMTVFWGILWGICLFNEKLSFFKVLGGFIVIIGVVLYSLDSRLENE